MYITSPIAIFHSPSEASPPTPPRTPQHGSSLRHLLPRQKWLLEHTTSSWHVIACFLGQRPYEKSFLKAPLKSDGINNELFSATFPLSVGYQHDPPKIPDSKNLRPQSLPPPLSQSYIYNNTIIESTPAFQNHPPTPSPYLPATRGHCF